MSKTVAEIMNRELFSLRPGDATAEALNYFTALGISGAPVVDEEGKPVGVVSFPDLVAKSARSVGECMTTELEVIAPTARVDAAARVLANARAHRLIVCDETGHVVGMVSASDMVRALVGLPPAHPDAFPHLDQETGLSLCDARSLTAEGIEAAPDAPGVFTLSVGGVGLEETALWAESAAHSVRARLYELISVPQLDRRLARLLETHHEQLRYQVVKVVDREERQQALEKLQNRLFKWLNPRRN